MDYISIIYFAVIVVLMLFIVSRLGPTCDNEHFDTYWNHSMGAQTMFEQTEPKVAESLKESERLAKYIWSEKDPDDTHGRRIYDKYYENHVQNTIYPREDPTYVERSLITPGDGHIDTKFEHLGSNNYATYDLKGMADPDPLYTQVFGETIALSQKNF